MPQASFFYTLEKILAEKINSSDRLISLTPDISDIGRTELAEARRGNIADRIERELSSMNGNATEAQRALGVRYFALEYQRSYYSALKQLEEAEIVGCYDFREQKRVLEFADGFLIKAIHILQRAKEIFPDLTGYFDQTMPVRYLSELRKAIATALNEPGNMPPLIRMHIHLRDAIKSENYELAAKLRDSIKTHQPASFFSFNSQAA